MTFLSSFNQWEFFVPGETGNSLFSKMSTAPLFFSSSLVILSVIELQQEKIQGCEQSRPLSKGQFGVLPKKFCGFVLVFHTGVLFSDIISISFSSSGNLLGQQISCFSLNALQKSKCCLIWCNAKFC